MTNTEPDTSPGPRVDTEGEQDDAARERIKALRRRTVVGAGYACVALAVAWAWWGDSWDPARWIRVARVTGWAASAGLVLTLAVTPFAGVHRELRRWRRPLGLMTAALSTVHVLSTWNIALGDARATAWTWPSYRAGAVAWLVLMALAITSSAFVIRVTRLRLWKPLHRLVYVAGALVSWHVLTLPWAPVSFGVVLGAVVFALLAARTIRAIRARRRLSVTRE